MLYGDVAIRDLLEDGLIRDGVDPRQINPASLNLTLGNTFLVMKDCGGKPLTLGDEAQYGKAEIQDDGAFAIAPGQFVLATTREFVQMPTHIAGFVQGRSSIGRIGLTTQNAGFIDPGFHGAITLELVNESNRVINLKPGYPIAQLILFRASSVSRGYAGKYNGQIEATGSRMHQDAFNGRQK